MVSTALGGISDFYANIINFQSITVNVDEYCCYVIPYELVSFDGRIYLGNAINVYGKDETSCTVQIGKAYCKLVSLGPSSI